MKLLTRKVHRQGDKVSVSAEWRDRMKRPANVKLIFERGEAVSNEDLFSKVPAEDANGTLFGLAEIAWEMGWRPRGLMGFVAHMIETYRLPPDEKR